MSYVHLHLTLYTILSQDNRNLAHTVQNQTVFWILGLLFVCLLAFAKEWPLVQLHCFWEFDEGVFGPFDWCDEIENPWSEWYFVWSDHPWPLLLRRGKGYLVKLWVMSWVRFHQRGRDHEDLHRWFRWWSSCRPSWGGNAQPTCRWLWQYHQ